MMRFIFLKENFYNIALFNLKASSETPESCDIKIKSEKLPSKETTTTSAIESTSSALVEIKEETVENNATDEAAATITTSNKDTDRLSNSNSSSSDDDDVPLSEIKNRSKESNPKGDTTPTNETSLKDLKAGAEPKPTSDSSTSVAKNIKTDQRKEPKKPSVVDNKSNNVVTRSRSSSKVNVLLSSSSSSSPSSSLPSSTSSASAHSSSSDSSTEEDESSAKRPKIHKNKTTKTTETPKTSSKNSPTKDVTNSESSTRLETKGNTPQSSAKPAKNAEPGHLDDSELIFAPEIKDDAKSSFLKNRQMSVYDDIDNDNKANSSVFDFSDHDERKFKAKEVKKPSILTPKGKISKSDEQQLAASSKEEQPVENEQEDTGANRTLRSNKKPRTPSTANQPQQQNKRRSVSTKSSTNASEQSKQAADVANTSTSSSITDVNKSETTLALELTDAQTPATIGLVSIIKQEPIQLTTQLSDSQNLTGESNNTSASDSSKIPKEMKFEDEKAYKAWKKSIMMVLNNISCHKYTYF